MIYVFHINTDDNENGWFPPSNSSGKIYVNARGWTSNQQDSKPTYDQAEHFLRFLDKYVSHAVGNHYFLQWIKLNRSKTFLDKVTASDIAYTILVYENTKECGRKTCSSRQAPGLMKRGIMQCIIKTQVSCRKGKLSQKVWWWLDRQWSRVLPRIAQDLQGTQVKWCMEYTSRSLEFYQKKHYAREGKLRKNVRQVTKMTGKQKCQMEMRLMMLRKKDVVIIFKSSIWSPS